MMNDHSRTPNHESRITHHASRTTVISRRVIILAVIADLIAVTLLAVVDVGTASARYLYRADFTRGIGTGWTWIRKDATHVSVTARPGYLRMVTQYGGLLNWGDNAKNLMLRKPPAGNFVISTRVEFTPSVDFQVAGILVYQDDDNFLQLGRAYCDPKYEDCYGNGIYYDHEEGGTFLGHHAISTTVTSNAYLKIARQGQDYTAYYSGDGKSWTNVGTWTMSSAFKPLYVGLTVNDNYCWAPQIPADFDYFQIFMK